MIRKDVTPEETIIKLKATLKSIGIPIKIKKNNLGKKFYSIHVMLKHNKFYFTNGKGNNYKQALASGLGELFERAQSGTLITPNFLNFPSKQPFYNETHYTSKEFYEKFNNFLDSLVAEKLLPNNIYNLNLNETEILTASDYVCHSTQESVLLPYRLIRRLTHSNGLAAGNTMPEALTQGICEIFERYCFKTIVLNNLKVNKIDPSQLKNLKIDSYINYLENLNYEVSILDFSLNKYPVVAVMLQKDNQYCMAAGSDVDLDIALLRCFNELFQGLNKKTMNTKFKKIINSKTDTYSNWLKFFSSNNGNFNLNNITNKFSKVEKLPFKSVNSNNEAFNYLNDIINKQGKTLYYKDFSFLSFKTYHVYIPTMSEVQNISNEDLYLIVNYNLCKSYFFNPKMSVTNDQKEIILTCFKYLLQKNASAEYITPAQYFKCSASSKYYLKKFNFKLLLIMSLIIFNYNVEEYLTNNGNLIPKQEIDIILNQLPEITKMAQVVLKKSIVKKTKEYKVWNTYYNKLQKIASSYFQK